MSGFLGGIIILLSYFIIAVIFALILKKYVKPPQEVFRKILHIILLGSLFCFIYGFSSWWTSALASMLFAVVVYPFLAIGQGIKGYSKLLCERKTGEIKRSLLVVFTMFAIVISVCWGLLSDRVLVIISVYAWGFGDAAAALVGKRYGKNKIYKKKSLEGTISMLIVSFFTVVFILLYRGGMVWYGYIVTGLVTGTVSAVVELYTPDGFDTISVPLAAMSTLLPLVKIFGGII